MDINQLSEWLKVKKQTIYDWTHKGLIPHLKLGRLLRFDSKEIERWLKSRKTSSQLPP